MGKRIDRFGADQPVADIGALEHCRDAQFGRAVAFDILHRVDAGVDLAGEKGAIELLGPQRLAAKLSQRAILHPVAGRDHRHDLDRTLGPAVCGA